MEERTITEPNDSLVKCIPMLDQHEGKMSYTHTQRHTETFEGPITRSTHLWILRFYCMCALFYYIDFFSPWISFVSPVFFMLLWCTLHTIQKGTDMLAYTHTHAHTKPRRAV